jgi:hypothetical protein
MTRSRKEAAAARAAASGPRATFADLSRLLDTEPGGDWPSRVNPSLTHTQALTVLTKGVAAMPPDEVVEKSNRGVLMQRNVLRECRSREED